MKTKAIFYSIITICLISFNLNTALAGDIVWEIFKNKTSYDFSKLKTTDSIPDQIIKLDSLKTIDNSTLIDHFSSRIRGYLTPTVSGNYSFYFACDNVGQFWLSPDANDTNAKLKSEIFSAETDWNKNITTQQLIAGQKYFFEIMHYDSVYTDLIKLGWKIPGTTYPTAIKSTYITTSGDNVPMNKLSFTENTITVFQNSTFTPRYQILPWNTSNKEIVWSSSSSETIAYVDAKGIIHTLNSGGCQIIGKSAENPSITSTLNLTVTNYGPYFVKTNGNGKGKSWVDAISLTALLDILNKGNLQKQVNVYVAEGTYKPTNTTDRNKTFLVNNIRLVGGFAATSVGVDTTHRDIDLHKTILSGDIGVQGESYDNSYHVVSAIYETNSAMYTAPNSTIDGVTIRDGRASCSTYGSTPGIYYFKYDDNGGGVFSLHCNVLIKNCVISNNSAWNSGAGIFGHGKTIELQNSEITNNFIQQVIINTGGVFYLQLNGNGAGIKLNMSTLNATNCIFHHNNGTAGNGQSINLESAAANLENCSFYSNIGIHQDIYATASSLNINNSTIKGNVGVRFGASCNVRNSTINSIFDVAYTYGKTAILDNSIVAGYDLNSLSNPDLTVKYCILGNTLFGDNKTSIISNSITNYTTWLDTLAYNGGLTPTMKLKDIPVNPAIENGNPLYLGTMDQRGVVRSDKVSIGAYQFVKTTGIEINETNDLVKVYPNPVTDELSIELKGNTKRSDFKIVNLQGQVVSHGSLRASLKTK